MKNKDYSSTQYIFWLVAGSEIHVLKDCKNDYNRHATMGFILFMTWTFATFAGCFAGSYFGHSTTKTALFGLMWGLMIYAIDRGMVTSLKKDPTQKEQNFWMPFVTRAILGILIAFFISIPFEMMIFKENIQIQMGNDTDAAVKEKVVTQNQIHNTQGQQNQINEDKSFLKQYDTLLKNDCPLPEYISNMESFNQARVTASQLYEDYEKAKEVFENATASNPVDSLNQKILSREDKVLRRKYREIHGQYVKADEEAQNYLREASKIRGDYYVDIKNKQKKLGARLDADTARLNTSKKVIDSVQVGYTVELSELQGFTRQYEALNNAARQNNSVNFLLWLIRCVFFVIEILPTLYKLKTPVGDYDRAIYYREQEFDTGLVSSLETRKEAESLKKESEKTILVANEQFRMEKEIEINNTLIGHAGRVQQEVVITALEEWERRVKDEIGKKVDDFLRLKDR